MVEKYVTIPVNFKIPFCMKDAWLAQMNNLQWCVSDYHSLLWADLTQGNLALTGLDQADRKAGREIRQM